MKHESSTVASTENRINERTDKAIKVMDDARFMCHFVVIKREYVKVERLSLHMHLVVSNN